MNKLEGLIQKLSPKKDMTGQFEKLASCLMNHFLFKVGKTDFRIVECEFYFFSIDDIHHDPYVHQNRKQQECNTWYFHGAGLDVTIGNKQNFGGLLIRGIADVKSGNTYSGPLNVVSHLFNSIGNVYGSNSLLLKEVEGLNSSQPFFGPRVGLRTKDEDIAGFVNMNYRAISNISSSHRFKDKTIFAKANNFESIEKMYKELNK
jgi:hypothetical protein